MTVMGALCACGGGEEDSSPKPSDGGVYTDKFVCRYGDPYSGFPECREYHGAWTEADAKKDCNSIFSGVTGEVTHKACDQEGAFGCCTIDAKGDLYHVTWYYGGDKELTVEVCENMISGKWKGK
jgi:hypothetical protein